MQIRQRAIRTAAVTTAIASITFGLVAVGTARASSDPASSAGTDRTASSARPVFLAPEELPPHPGSPWYASDPSAGLPEFPVFCLEEALPAAGASHRLFWTEYDTGAEQISVRAATIREARTLAAEARQSVRGCAAALEESDPGAHAEFRDYGRVDVQEGAHVYGVDTAHDSGPSDVHLFGVGRDGRTVTVVAWGQMGDFAHAPVEDFRATARTAVEKLHG